MTQYCIDLESAWDVNQVGSKAANLAQVAALGFAVPQGFVLTRASLAHFLDENALTDRVRALLRNGQQLPAAEKMRRYEALRADVMAAPIPCKLSDEVVERAEALLLSASVGLAVRSSAVSEDTAEASFAGVYESTLGVTSMEELWDAIRACWCAFWHPRALAYATKMGLELEPDQMAVLVQTVVPADSAGVIFTADPLTGNPWRFVLNATLGLAQSLVDGSAPGDRYVLDWHSAEILERDIAEKPCMLLPEKTGVREIVIPEAEQRRPSLSDQALHQIGQVALDLDRAFNQRVNIEWAVAGDDLYIVQVRPITALPAFFPHALDGPDAEVTWRPSKPAWYTSIHEEERLVAPFYRGLWALELWERHLPYGFFPRRVGKERDFNGYRYQTEWTWKTWGHDYESTIRWLTEHKGEVRSQWLAQKAGIFAACEELAEAQSEARTVRELISLLLRALDLSAHRQAVAWGPAQWMGGACEYMLREFFQELAAKGCKSDVPISRLFQGLPCYSYERTKAAQVLGRSIREPEIREAFIHHPLDQILPTLVADHPDSAFMHDFAAFCWRFGLGAPEPATEWWRGWCQGDRVQALLAIRNAVLGMGQDVREVVASGIEDCESAEAELRTHIRRCAPELLARFDKILGWAQFWEPGLDNRKWLSVASSRLESLVWHTGKALVAEGVLDVPADLLLLTREDLGTMARAEDVRRYRSLAHQSKREYEANRRLVPPDFLGVPPEPQPSGPAVDREPRQFEPGTVLQGQGLTPGYVRGIVRKTEDPNDLTFLDTLTTEDIVVCPVFTSCNTDWLSLLMTVRGLVTIRGTHGGHTTQIARECGVPYVHLPDEAWDRVVDGQEIAVDGLEGTITILENCQDV